MINKVQYSKTRTIYTYEKDNLKIDIEVIEVHPDKKDSTSLNKIWFKNGSTPTLLDSYLCVTTFVTDDDGYHFNKYNPTIKDGLICFEWLLEANELNTTEIIDEIIERAEKGEE